MVSPLTRTHGLVDGLRVHLRLARRGDLAAVRALTRRRGIEAGDDTLSALLDYHPADRAVLCAFAPLGGSPTLVGIGAVDLAAGREPDTLVVDERLARGVGELLVSELDARVRMRARRAAA
jgi:hypothetical protein